jgi:hypothetical protein
MKTLKVFKLICDDGSIAYTRHTNIDEVKKLYLNEMFRDSDSSLKRCIEVMLHLITKTKLK